MNKTQPTVTYYAVDITDGLNSRQVTCVLREGYSTLSDLPQIIRIRYGKNASITNVQPIVPSGF